MNRGHRILVLVAEDAAERQLARLQGAYRVLTVLRPRIAVLQIDDAAVDELRRDPEIAGVYERDVPPEVIARLRQDERLFVEAWVEQQVSGDKQRRVEGLSWDAPGFEPPHAYTCAWTPAGGWRGWWRIGDAVFPRGAMITAVVRGQDHLDIFGTDRVEPGVRRGAPGSPGRAGGPWANNAAGLRGGRGTPHAPIRSCRAARAAPHRMLPEAT